MGSPIVGRTPCPFGDFDKAHVKKSEKCYFVYCPMCTGQLIARTPEQERLLLAKTTLAEPIASPSATAPAAPAPAPEPAPAPPPSASAASAPVAPPPPAKPKRSWADI